MGNPISVDATLSPQYPLAAHSPTVCEGWASSAPPPRVVAGDQRSPVQVTTAVVSSGVQGQCRDQTLLHVTPPGPPVLRFFLLLPRGVLQPWRGVEIACGPSMPASDSQYFDEL